MKAALTSILFFLCLPGHSLYYYSSAETLRGSNNNNNNNNNGVESSSSNDEPYLGAVVVQHPAYDEEEDAIEPSFVNDQTLELSSNDEIIHYHLANNTNTNNNTTTDGITEAEPSAVVVVLEEQEHEQDDEEESDADRMMHHHRNLAFPLWIKNKATGLVLTVPVGGGITYGSVGSVNNNYQKWVQVPSLLYVNPWYGPFYLNNVGTGENLEVLDIGGWSWELFYVNNGIVIRHWLTTDVINMNSDGTIFVEVYIPGKTSQIWTFR